MQAEAEKPAGTRELVALVTGAGRGLGRALVEELLQRDTKRIYAGARSPAMLDDLTARHGNRVVALALDITDLDSIEAASRQAGDVGLLINNAGIGASRRSSRPTAPTSSASSRRTSSERWT